MSGGNTADRALTVIIKWGLHLLFSVEGMSIDCYDNEVHYRSPRVSTSKTGGGWQSRQKRSLCGFPEGNCYTITSGVIHHSTVVDMVAGSSPGTLIIEWPLSGGQAFWKYMYVNKSKREQTSCFEKLRKRLKRTRLNKVVKWFNEAE